MHRYSPVAIFLVFLGFLFFGACITLILLGALVEWRFTEGFFLIFFGSFLMLFSLIFIHESIGYCCVTKKPEVVPVLPVPVAPPVAEVVLIPQLEESQIIIQSLLD